MNFQELKQNSKNSLKRNYSWPRKLTIQLRCTHLYFPSFISPGKKQEWNDSMVEFDLGHWQAIVESSCTLPLGAKPPWSYSCPLPCLLCCLRFSPTSTSQTEPCHLLLPLHGELRVSSLTSFY